MFLLSKLLLVRRHRPLLACVVSDAKPPSVRVSAHREPVAVAQDNSWKKKGRASRLTIDLEDGRDKRLGTTRPSATTITTADSFVKFFV
jgi:hypothetical protein